MSLYPQSYIYTLLRRDAWIPSSQSVQSKYARSRKWAKTNLSLPVSNSTIFGIILAVGLSVGSTVLMTHCGGFPDWVQYIAVGGTGLFSISTITGIAYIGKSYFDRYHMRKAHPNLFVDDKDLSSPPQIQVKYQSPHQRIELNSEGYGERLNNAGKMEAGAAVYYDLTQDPSIENPVANTLELREQGDYLQIPHIGEYDGAGYAPDDHYMAVRLPSSQLNKFPDAIRRNLQDIDNPDLFFVVFKNKKNKKDGFYDLSMHAMVLNNYDHNNPNNPTGGLTKGQVPIQRDEGQGLMTKMQIRMCNTVGIDTTYGREVIPKQEALTGSTKTVSPSIHTDRTGQHLFSDKHARIKVENWAPVSCFDIVGKTPDGHGFAFRALIVNDEKDEVGEQLVHAIPRGESLTEFLETVNSKLYKLDRGIKERIVGILTPVE